MKKAIARLLRRLADYLDPLPAAEPSVTIPVKDIPLLTGSRVGPYRPPVQDRFSGIVLLGERVPIDDERKARDDFINARDGGAECELWKNGIKRDWSPR